MSADDDLKWLTTANDELQQSVIVGRLSEAGIRCMGSSSSGTGLRRGVSGQRDIYVKAADLERAQALLKQDEAPFDENELARLAEEAGKRHPAEP
jgi:hypothetical protein